MKNKISVIFLFACLILYFIYYKFNDKNIDILYIGDNLLFNKIKNELPGYSFNNYSLDDITYKKINMLIKNNDYKVIKDKFIYLNQLLKKSDYIIINANDFEYKIKCRKNSRIITEYNKKVLNDIKNLINSIFYINDPKIFIIDNGCDYLNNNKIYDNFVFIDVNNLKNIKDYINNYKNN